MEYITLENRIIDKEGNVVYFPQALIELMYRGIIPSNSLYISNDKDVELFNEFSRENRDDVEYTFPKSLKTIEERKNDWFYPEFYDKIVLEDYFLNLCQTDEEKDRVKMEVNMFIEKGMDKFLRFCIYFSNKIKENNWVVGVGRGSSVASFCLYLLKIHLVNSLKYNLDIKEFLK